MLLTHDTRLIKHLTANRRSHRSEFSATVILHKAGSKLSQDHAHCNEIGRHRRANLSGRNGCSGNGIPASRHAGRDPHRHRCHRQSEEQSIRSNSKICRVWPKRSGSANLTSSLRLIYDRRKRSLHVGEAKIGGDEFGDHRRSLRGREPREDFCDCRSCSSKRRQFLPRRRLQAAHFALRISRLGRRRLENPVRSAANLRTKDRR